ncbi:MAG: glycosyltransferase family 2 protein [Bacteroidales bacterium]|nr:glycosyltransferase family 2 protein [Bacteroidales bacterium]
MILSIIIPVYNEDSTIVELLEKVLKVRLVNNFEKEIIIIDDNSSDNTKNLIKEFISKNEIKNITLLSHLTNKGKGASIKTGIPKTKGDYIIIQDADLEYVPDEYNLLLEAVVKGNADVVYGSRFNTGKPNRKLFFWHDTGNRFLTFMSNLFTNLNLTDMETCYKLFRSDILKQITLKENRFGFEPEVTAKISKIPGIKIFEVGISYYGRTYKEGKKVNWKDGMKALFCIIKYNLF